MMDYCKSCAFYSSVHDEHRQMWDDVLNETEPVTQKHFCPMYDAPIDNAIITGEKECKFYISYQNLMKGR